MRLLLDTYNVLHAWRSGPIAGDSREVAALAERIEASTFRSPRLICDGTPPGGPSEPLHWRVGRVQIIYAGPGRDADSLIEKLIREDSAPSRLLVVSSDRRILKAARRRRAPSMESPSFLAQLASPGQPVPTPAEETAAPADLKEWLRAFGDDPQEPRQPQPRTPRQNLEMRPDVPGRHTPDLPSPIADDALIDEASRAWPDRFDPDELDPRHWAGDED
jgi:hypothetical protein